MLDAVQVAVYEAVQVAVYEAVIECSHHRLSQFPSSLLHRQSQNAFRNPEWGGYRFEKFSNVTLLKFPRLDVSRQCVMCAVSTHEWMGMGMGELQGYLH